MGTVPPKCRCGADTSRLWPQARETSTPLVRIAGTGSALLSQTRLRIPPSCLGSARTRSAERRAGRGATVRRPQRGGAPCTTDARTAAPNHMPAFPLRRSGASLKEPQMTMEIHSAPHFPHIPAPALAWTPGASRSVPHPPSLSFDDTIWPASARHLRLRSRRSRSSSRCVCFLISPLK